MTAREFIEKEWFVLTLDCSRDIETIYQALEDYAKHKALSIANDSKRIFAIKDTSGEWIKLCSTKEIAEKELKKCKNKLSYTGFYIDEEYLY